uniref:Uncharacterized protein n=1 Tax=Oryza sativa subsp. japonica TaxID=39947 RepID=Q8L672_ORYSJ|nr:hypothetical protein [Oryza sativa Japonica Group]
MAKRGSRAVAGCGRSGRRASPAAERRQRSAVVERRLRAAQPHAVAAVVVGSPPSSSSGSGGGGSVADLIAWSSRTPSSRSCSRSVSTLGVPSASWTVVGTGAVTLVVFADIVVALDVVAHTHIRRGVQRKASAAEERRRASAAVGKAAEGKLGEAEDSGWDEELPRARPPPPPCPRGWPTMLGEAPPAGEGEEAEEAIVSWSPAASPSLPNSLAAALALRSSLRGLLALHCSARRRARAFRCSVAALALRCAARIRARRSARCLRSAARRPHRIASPTATTTVESRRRRWRAGDDGGHGARLLCPQPEGEENREKRKEKRREGEEKRRKKM